MSQITPHLWFETDALEAADFYVSLFPGSRVTSKSQVRNTPSGDCDIVSFELAGEEFMAISAGPLFKFNPAISFIVNFDPSRDAGAQSRIDEVWGSLLDGGNVLMPIGEYPFSKRYGWVADRFGLTWQLMLTDPSGEPRPPIIPALMFTGGMTGKAEEAAHFYLSVFDDSELGNVIYYPPEEAPDAESNVMFADFRLGDTWIAAMDSGEMHDFGFNEAVSFLVPCENQDQIDRYWSALSADPEAEQCGWLKDRYGLSWQIWPRRIGEMMSNGTPEQVDRLTRTFLAMKKYDIAELEAAFAGQ